MNKSAYLVLSLFLGLFSACNPNSSTNKTSAVLERGIVDNKSEEIKEPGSPKIADTIEPIKGVLVKGNEETEEEKSLNSKEPEDNAIEPKIDKTSSSPSTDDKKNDLAEQSEKLKYQESVPVEINAAEERKSIPAEEQKPEEIKNVETIQEEPSPDSEEKIELKPDHRLWDALLKQNVSSSGVVNYKGIKADQSKLDAYMRSLNDNPIQTGWSKNEKMAYWINAYNAFTVKLIVDNYPISSITKLHGGKPWDVKWIKLGDKTYSLNNIENDILRPQYKDPRIHFAVNCAAKSCPSLLNEAWTSSNLESNFERTTKAFINNSLFNDISPKSIKVSKIFDWYKSDFGDLISFLNKYSNVSINSNAKIEYMEYNWQLNE